MKKCVISYLVILFTFFSCNKTIIDDDETVTVPENKSAYSPVLMSREQLNQSISVISPQPIKDPGKIYFKDNYIFLNERYKGIHIINNLDPSNPIKKGFLRIPGCIDMAIRINKLYADNAVDLVTLDLSNLDSVRLSGRINDIFPEHFPPDLASLPQMFSKPNRPDNTIIIEWIKTIK